MLVGTILWPESKKSRIESGTAPAEDFVPLYCIPTVLVVVVLVVDSSAMLDMSGERPNG